MQIVATVSFCASHGDVNDDMGKRYHSGKSTPQNNGSIEHWGKII